MHKKINWKPLFSIGFGCWLFLSASSIVGGTYGFHAGIVTLAQPGVVYSFLISILMTFVAPIMWIGQTWSGPTYSLSISPYAYIFANLFLLISLFLWVKKPWHWWSAANLIIAGTLTTWFYPFIYGHLPETLIGAICTYPGCFLGFLGWKKYGKYIKITFSYLYQKFQIHIYQKYIALPPNTNS